MTENPADIRREIEIAREAMAATGDAMIPVVTNSIGHVALRAGAEEFGRHLYQLHLRLARAERDPTNQQRT